jgi:hypothetical protein
MLNDTCNYVYFHGDRYSLIVRYILVGLVIHLISFNVVFYVLIIDNDDDDDDDNVCSVNASFLFFHFFFLFIYLGFLEYCIYITIWVYIGWFGFRFDCF